MHNPLSLLDLYTRAHQNLKQLLDHCKRLSAEELHREIKGFGYPTVQLQLHHVFQAERYWFGVLEGRIDVNEDQDNYSTIEKLAQLEQEVFAIGQGYLDEASETELNTPRKMMTWGNKERTLTPMHVVMRPVTHGYHHTGQIVAMTRLMGHPLEDSGINFPIIP